MAIADLSGTNSRVKRHYDAYPYPPRDPAEESQRLVIIEFDQLSAVNHYCFRGQRDFSQGFRVLVAGGGTGDSTIFLAHQLRQTDATIVHLDLSDSAMQIARQRAASRGLESCIIWHRGSLLDLPTFGWEPFDYITCIGVLHHLADPEAGLAALRSVLKDDGALGLMLYGQYGRTSIYQIQELMRLVNHDQRDPQQMVSNTRAVIQSLPRTSWHKQRQEILPGIIHQTFFLCRGMFAVGMTAARG